MNATLQHVPLKEIKPDPDQPRKTLDEAEFAALVASVAQHGVLSPLTLRKNGSGYIIVAGERRYRAALKLDLPQVPAQIIEADDIGKQSIAALVENLVREDLNPIEEGDAYTRLLAAGMTTEQIAEQVSRPEGRVNDRLALAALPAAARTAVIERRVTLPDVRQYTNITDGPLAEALCFAADVSGRWSSDPWRVFFDLDHIDPTQQHVPCSACDGDGYDENDVACPECKGRGEVVKVDKKAPKIPAFFAWALWRDTPLQDVMLKQLTAAARKSIKETQAKADAHYEVLKKKSSWERPLRGMAFDDQAIADVAIAGGYAVPFGNNRYVVTDPAFVSEYLPGAFAAQVEEYVSPKRGGGGKAESTKGRTLTKAEQAAADERAKERAKAAKQRGEGRQFNERLGIAIQTKLGEVPVNLEATKLMVQTILDLTKRTATYGGGAVGGEGHALYHRFTNSDWPTTKAGDYKIPRKSDERAKFVADVYKQAEKELAAARKPEQALGVLVRFLAHGLVDLRGLPKADLEGQSPLQVQRDGWRSFVLARLPKPIRDRAPKARATNSSW